MELLLSAVVKGSTASEWVKLIVDSMGSEGRKGMVREKGGGGLKAVGSCRTHSLFERAVDCDRRRGEWMAVGGREGRREIKGTRTTKGNMRPRIGSVATDSSHRHSHPLTVYHWSLHHLSLLSPHHSSIPDPNFSPDSSVVSIPATPVCDSPGGSCARCPARGPFQPRGPFCLLDPIPRVRRQASFPGKSPSFNHHHHTLTYSIPIPTGYPS